MKPRDYKIEWIDNNGCHNSYMGYGNEREMKRKYKQFSHYPDCKLIVEGEVQPIKTNLK